MQSSKIPIYIMLRADSLGLLRKPCAGALQEDGSESREAHVGLGLKYRDGTLLGLSVTLGLELSKQYLVLGLSSI